MLTIKSYKEFAGEHKKYDGSSKCFVQGCDKPAYYEGGDSRFYCGMCEDHVALKEQYISYLKGLERKIRTRMLWWDKNDPTLELLYNKVIANLNNVVREQND